MREVANQRKEAELKFPAVDNMATKTTWLPVASKSGLPFYRKLFSNVATRKSAIVIQKTISEAKHKLVGNVASRELAVVSQKTGPEALQKPAGIVSAG